MTDFGAPEQADLMHEAAESAFANLHVCYPGIVQSYDDTKKTCSVLPATRRVLLTEDGTIVTEELPVIQNVPVHVIGSPALTLEFELVKGDTVLLVFFDWSIAGWRKSGAVSDPQDARKHGPAYPIAIPWFRPSGAPSSDEKSTIGKAGGVRVHFKDATVEIGSGSDFVAMAAKTDARLDAIETWAASVTFPVVSLGSPTGTAVPPLTPGGGSTASANLKAE